MKKHDELLSEGPRQAEEPETAEERTRRLRGRAVGGGVLAGGAGALKLGLIGGLGKALLWLVAWHTAWSVGRTFGVVGVIVVLAAIATAALVLRSRRAVG